MIKIDSSVTEEQRSDPRFQRLHQDAEKYFNTRTDTEKLLIGLHEAGHSYYARRAGASKILFLGPCMYWDSRPLYNCPAISKASVKWLPAWTPATSAAANLKAFIGGFICRRELTGEPNEQVAVEMDIEGWRELFDRYVGFGDDAFKAALADAEREILIDLRSPYTRHEIWAEARRFVAEIFPPDNSAGIDS